jgi:NADPH:quinone reductase
MGSILPRSGRQSCRGPGFRPRQGSRRRTPDHTILVGGHPRAKAPVILGNEGAGVIEESAVVGLNAGDRVAFTGVLASQKMARGKTIRSFALANLLPVPDQIDDVLAAI